MPQVFPDKIEMGISEIDKQHLKLLSIIETLAVSMEVGKGREVLAEIFTDLGKYTVEHFRAEENLMKMYNYPDYDFHKKQHEILIVQLGKLREKFNSGGQNAVQTLFFLRDWLNGHIKGCDQEYGPFLRGKGVR